MRCRLETDTNESFVIFFLCLPLGAFESRSRRLRVKTWRNVWGGESLAYRHRWSIACGALFKSDEPKEGRGPQPLNFFLISKRRRIFEENPQSVFKNLYWSAGQSSSANFNRQGEGVATVVHECSIIFRFSVFPLRKILHKFPPTSFWLSTSDSRRGRRVPRLVRGHNARGCSRWRRINLAKFFWFFLSLSLYETNWWCCRWKILHLRRHATRKFDPNASRPKTSPL